MFKIYLRHYYEQCIGHLKGFYILITNPRKYLHLKKIRGNYFSKLKIKNEFIKLIKKKLNENNLSSVLIYSRVKTIGSLDRKCKYQNIVYPEVNLSFLQDDLIGVKFFVNNKKDCNILIKLIKEVAPFPKFKSRLNPRNHFINPKKCKHTNASLCKCITGNILFKDSLIHIFILVKSDRYFHYKERKLYLSEVRAIIKNHKKKIK